ncbi:MAG: hypothetical protein MUP22_00605 [Desulfobacterales bacterium]|nr:hypothetical protein [Desulfobacterales bacterium]
MDYIQSPSLFGNLIRLPDKFSEKSSYPLLIGLHGGSHSAENLISIWDDQIERGFIYVVPQAPYPIFEDQKARFDWAMWPTENEDLIKQATELSVKYIVNVTNNLCNQYDIGDVYLMGFSQGAIFSYLVGMRNHDIISGIISLSGPGLLEPLINPFAGSFYPDWIVKEEIHAARKLKVFIVHGEDDRSVKYELAIKSRDLLLENDFDVTFRGFSGGHEYPPSDILTQINHWLENSEQRSK